MADSEQPPAKTTLISHNGGGIVARKGMRIDEMPGTLARDADGIKARFNAMRQSSLELGRDGTLMMTVQDVIAYWRESAPDEQGEIHDFSWLVLIDPRGETFGTSSPVVAEKVGQLLALRSASAIEWPVDVQIVSVKARKSGQVYHDLVML